jgi:hypothetical protein
LPTIVASDSARPSGTNLRRDGRAIDLQPRNSPRFRAFAGGALAVMLVAMGSALLLVR